MQKIKVFTWCDHPHCQEFASYDKYPDGQETRPIMIWIYTPGKGQKPKPIKVEVCVEHEADLKNLYNSMRKFDQGTE